ncbi:hypothetical protein SAMN05421741_10290 [Paenimyroides ummariense]|uniref:Uncharacterized protein n=1 Tax=Paenimyroides ummariense TaxID=913024 RepID=A0A1I4X511_9FLAO|nr:hypothetical protein [Paenimyroides ummariense]SFN20309.1 hypothetical protein SAMN05421741_10290 [Paenimyroides ummariense]
MKKLLLSAFVAFAMLASTKTFAQQGFGTNEPDKSAAVEILSNKRGLLIPRLNLTAANVAAPVISPAQSLLVYNTATSSVAADPANHVTPGFYYWDTNRWVRFRSEGSEKNTIVTAGENIKVNGVTSGLTTTYTVSVDGGTNNGQVLVSIPNTDPATVGTEPFVSKWVDPDDFIKGVNGIDVTTDPTTGVTNVGLGGALTDATGTEIITDPTTGRTLAIQGLEVLTPSTFNTATQNIMVMGVDGILKQVAPKTLIEDAIAADNLTAKALSSAGGIITVNGSASVANSVLKDVELGIANKSIGAEKLNPGAATPGQIATVIETTPGDATTKVVQYQDPSTAIGQPLTTDNIIGVGADATAASATTANLLNGAVLTPTYLKIKDDAITATQIAENAVGASELADNSVASANIIDGSIANADLGEKSVSANKLTSTVTNAAGVVTSTAPANTVPTADGSGGVTYQTIAAAAGEDLTTDGKIVIGSTNVTTLADAVLVPTRLSIAAESITSADIKNGTITTTDIKAPNSSTDNNLDGDENMVMVTDSNGDVTWIAQSSLANKDNYNFTTPLAKDAGTANANGGTDYTVSIATASATTLGVVKQSAATGEEITIATDGSLSINEANVTVGTVAGSDVTGKLNDLTVTGIQGTAVSATAPTAANNMLVYNSTTNQWEPSTVAAAAGKTLTGAGITVTPGANATPGTATSLASTVLADVTLGIANDAITNDKLADDAVKTENIENGAVTNEDLALKAVTADKMESKNTAAGTNVSAGMVPTADGIGGVEYRTINNTVAVINGLRKDATAADVIKLGGDLIEATAINTSVGSAGNTLAITGLVNVAPATATKNKVIVAETTGGVLRTVDKIVTGTNVEVAANANYSFHTPEVVINITLGNTDQTITFPSAASAEGQVINIKIANTTEAHTGYLNVLDTYGAMPYQAWIVKSNGTTWEIVGRN